MSPRVARARGRCGETLERSQRTFDARLRVGWQAVRVDHAPEIFDRGGAQPDDGHAGLELVERDRFACAGLLESELSALVRTGDAVE